MADQQHYIFISSDDSTNYHPTNSPSQFCVELPQTLNLPGVWYCALTDIQLKGSAPVFEEMNVVCDLCEHSYIRNNLQPILRRIPGEGKKRTTYSFSPLYYFKVSCDQVNRININILDSKLSPASVLQGTLICTLHLRRAA